MPDEVNFMDLVSLIKLTPDTTLEKFGSLINSSIYDAGNISGSLKQKGLIDFTTYYPGPNTILVTDAGKALIAEADAKSAEPFDKLDEEILGQMSIGKRMPTELQNTISLRSKDLALHLYKLYKQGLLIYEFKNGTVELLLTEQGFLKVKNTPKIWNTAVQTAKAEAATDQQQAAQPEAQQPEQPVDVNNIANDLNKMPVTKKPSKMIVIAVVATVIAIIIVVYFLHSANLI